MEIEDLVEEYFNELKESSDFKRLLELKDYINKNYANLIIGMKTKESLYLEANI